jgi:hypothetical protein
MNRRRQYFYLGFLIGLAGGGALALILLGVLLL